MTRAPHVSAAKRWAREIVAGKRTAGRWTILAAKRFLNDLKSEKLAPFKYYFSDEAAERFCRFAERLPHVKGKWAATGERFVLEAWQCFFSCNLFGWLEKKTNLRRFNKAYLRVARKNGKSFLAAVIGLYMFVADGEFGAEVYSGATNEKQAWEVFRPAHTICKRFHEFRLSFGIVCGAKNLYVERDLSRFEPVIGTPGDGPSPSCAITDEYHEHLTDRLVDTMETGMGARDQPISLIITTSGSTLGGPCHVFDEDCKKILSGVVPDERTFALIFEPDQRDPTDKKVKYDKWTSNAALKKANPNLNVSVGLEWLKQQRARAIRDGAKQNRFKTKHLNIWVNASVGWMNLEKWANNTQKPLDIQDFKGADCYGGLDLATKLDLTSFGKVFPDSEAGIKRFYYFGRHYCPEAQALLPERARYRGWVTDGLLIATKGDIIDYDRIEADIEKDDKEFNLLGIGHDPFGAAQLAQNLIKKHLCPDELGDPNIVEVFQRASYLSEPMKWVQALAYSSNFFQNDPILDWAVSNVMVRDYQDDTIFPRKERDINKIDPFVALLMAIKMAMVEADVDSIYEDQDLTVV